MAKQSDDEIRDKIKKCWRWYHQIELAPGVVTPGIHNSPKALEQLDRIGFPANLTGKRVLDVGARDGFFSFIAEKRGAEVVAVDYAEPSVTGFGIAAELLGSRVPYHVDNVYFLTPEKYGTFDIILFLGVIYHLRNPMLALDRLRRLCKPDAQFYVESQIMGERLTARLRRVSRFLALLQGKKEADTDIPLWRLVPGNSLNDDGTNCWVPNMEGLTIALQESEFKVLASSVDGLRGLVAARAHSDAEAAKFRDLDTSTASLHKEHKRQPSH